MIEIPSRVNNSMMLWTWGNKRFGTFYNSSRYGWLESCNHGDERTLLMCKDIVKPYKMFITVWADMWPLKPVCNVLKYIASLWVNLHCAWFLVGKISYCILRQYTVYRKTLTLLNFGEFSLKTFWRNKLWRIAARNTKAPLILSFYKCLYSKLKWNIEALRVVALYWLVLFWRFELDSSNLPNFPFVKVSRYTVVVILDNLYAGFLTNTTKKLLKYLQQN